MASTGSDRQDDQSSESRDSLHRHLVERAKSSSKSIADAGDGWDDPDSAGTYYGLWKRWAAVAAAVGAGVSLVVAGTVLLGQAIGPAWMRGEYFGARPLTFVAAATMALLAISILLLRDEKAPPLRRALAEAVAGGVLLASIAVGINQLLGLGLIEWSATGFFRSPSVTPTVVAILVSIGLLTVDRDAPRFRWGDWIAPLIGLALVVGLLSRGHQGQVFYGLHEPRLSFSGAVGMCGLAIGFVFLRPQRGITGFLLSSGPGPSMARLLAPVVAMVPVVTAVGYGLANRMSTNARAVVRGLDELIVVIALVAIVAYTSRRLQRYFGGWQTAINELAEQANVLSAMTEGVAMVRLSDRTIVFSNHQFESMHGFGPDEMVGNSIDVLMPEDLTEKEMLRRERVGWELADRGSSLYENRSLCRDGSVIWCRTNAILTDDVVHGPALVLVKNDISAERLARAESEDAELRFKQVFEQSPIGLCLVRADGSFERVNRNFEEITGYSSEELYEMTFADITHPDDIDQDLELSGAMFRGATEGFQMEKRYIRKGGDVVWVNLTVTMLTDSGGQPYIALSMIQDVTERHELSRQLQHLADRDPLTGLYNRRRFEQELSRALDVSPGERGRGLAVMVVDLDNFKFVNDNYGHSVGDQLIVRTGEVLKSRLRSSDVVARLGGDEFVIMLGDITAADAMKMADGLVREIAEKARIQGQGFLARATASIGVVMGDGIGSAGLESLVTKADVAMYEVKDSGRNGARMYSPKESTEVFHWVDWHERIRDALDHDGFVLYAQPVVSLRGEQVPGFELFLRLTDADGAVVGPGTFMPVAERHNLVREIDHWVIRHAIDRLREVGPEHPLRLFVNLSGQSVGDPDLLAFISSELSRAGVDPGALVFEISETSTVGDIRRAQNLASNLSDIGCRLALDDFGAGFASFYYLKHIASSFVKIDGEFIRNLAGDQTNRLLVKALADVTHGMGKRTVAEHVEDINALAMLDEYGVDFAQGNLLGEPKPLSEVDLASVPEVPQLPEPAGY